MRRRINNYVKPAGTLHMDLTTVVFFDDEDHLGTLEAIDKATRFTKTGKVAVFRPINRMIPGLQCVGHSPSGRVCLNCGGTIEYVNGQNM